MPRWVLAALLALLLWRTHSPREGLALVPHLRDVQHRIEHGGAEDMQALFPEGFVFSHAMTALAWTELAIDLPAEHPVRAEAIDAVHRSLAALESPAGTAPFSPSLSPPHGVFHAAWRNHVRAGLVWLTDDPTERATLTMDCTVLARAFDAWSDPFLESYPGQAWPVDSVVGISSLTACEHLLGVDHRSTVERWRASARDRAPDGLFHYQGERVRRASSTVVMLRFLHEVDPAWARTHYDQFRSDFVTTRASLPAVQEYADGRGTGDVDTGPLLWGVSLASTVIGGGVARLYGDERLYNGIHGLGEALAMPLPTRRGRSWALGLLPVGEAFVLWSRTARPWFTEPVAVQTPSPVPPFWWRLWWEGPLWLLVVLLVTYPSRAAR